MTAATSASDRYDEANKALSQLGLEITWARQVADENRQGDGHAQHVASLIEAQDALRALITPPATNEAPDAVAARFEDDLYMRGTIDVLGGFEKITARDSGVPARKLYAEAHRLGYLAGIQAAWESWEPADLPSLPEFARDVIEWWDAEASRGATEDAAEAIRDFTQKWQGERN